MANDIHMKPRFGLLLILLTIAGFIISFIAIHILDGRRLGHIGEATIIGTVVGFMQWIALRRVIKIEITWVLANIIGFLVFSGLGGSFPQLKRGTFRYMF